MSDKPLPWIKFWATFATNDVIQDLSMADQRHYMMVVLYRSQNPGSLNLLDKGIAHYLRISKTAWSKVRGRLLEVELITAHNIPTDWKASQEPSKDAKRQRDFRERNKIKLEIAAKASQPTPITAYQRGKNDEDCIPFD